ncbi:unnamed protein product [Haemonchus placei]|uniref:Copper transporter n=1 Tax=Haemonchus placei TaxID=6290 RepID=A0A0N4W511_HAEPC|nr:unnamed protein product [Haemonchus placei]
MYEAVLWISYRNPCDMFPARGAYHFYAVMEMYCLMHMISLQMVVLATIVFSAMMLACSEVHLRLIENERDINYIIKEGHSNCSSHSTFPYTAPTEEKADTSEQLDPAIGSPAHVRLFSHA